MENNKGRNPNALYPGPAGERSHSLITSSVEAVAIALFADPADFDENIETTCHRLILKDSG
jgi:hypothetical protein